MGDAADTNLSKAPKRKLAHNQRIVPEGNGDAVVEKFGAAAAEVSEAPREQMENVTA